MWYDGLHVEISFQINQVLPDINSLLDDPATGGGMVKGHSMVLGLHLLRKFKSWQRFSELLSQQYDSICRGINCLKTLHDQLKVDLAASGRSSVVGAAPARGRRVEYA